MSNEQNTASRYCACYVKRQVTKHIHVCRKCGLKIFHQDVLSWAQVASIIVMLLGCLAILAYGQQHWGARP